MAIIGLITDNVKQWLIVGMVSNIKMQLTIQSIRQLNVKRRTNRIP